MARWAHPEPRDETFHCAYVEDWVDIKAAWDLSVDAAERDAIAEILSGCG